MARRLTQVAEVGIIIAPRMNSASNWQVTAVVGILCVLTVFFCPVMQGPYSVVHGPVTALQGARAAAGSRMAMVRAALALSSFSIGPLPTASALALPHFDVLPDSSIIRFDMTLRC